jgi:hypothetical protein
LANFFLSLSLSLSLSIKNKIVIKNL